MTTEFETGHGFAEVHPELHIGRSWPGMRPEMEEGCPCPKEPCGLVNVSKVVPDCPQHSLNAAKTIRQGHRPEDCPGARPNADRPSTDEWPYPDEDPPDPL